MLLLVPLAIALHKFLLALQDAEVSSYSGVKYIMYPLKQNKEKVNNILRINSSSHRPSIMQVCQ